MSRHRKAYQRLVTAAPRTALASAGQGEPLRETLVLRPSAVTDGLLATLRTCTETSEASDALSRKLSDDLDSVLHSVVADNPAFRWIWFDGVLPRTIRIGTDDVLIEGGLWFVDGQKQSFVPVRATFAIGAAGDELRFRISFVATHPGPTHREPHRMRIPDDDDDWKYVFEGVVAGRGA